MLRYAITDATRTAATPSARLAALRAAARRWSFAGVDFIQLREKTLAAGELFFLAEALCRDLTETGSRTRLLVNGRADVAVAAGAHGVHLTAAPGELTPRQVRDLFGAAGRAKPVVSLACHTVAEAIGAQSAGADLLLASPVFEKVVGSTRASEGRGLAFLREAAQAAGGTPVLALGGITAANTAACLQSGAAGIAGIRLFA